MHPGTRPARFPHLGRSPAVSHAGIPPRFLRAFPGHPGQVAVARHYVARALAACPAAADAVLLTSELATNAVQHTATGQGGTFAVAILHAPGRVRVTVADDGSATLPVMAEAQEMSISGRGLILVDCLAVRWGCASSGPGGRLPSDPGSGPAGAPVRAAVWFELACQ